MPATSRRLSSSLIILFQFSSNSFESHWRHPLRSWLTKKRRRSFRRVLEEISGPRRLLGMWPCSHGFAAVSHILGFENAQRGSLCSLDLPVKLTFLGRVPLKRNFDWFGGQRYEENWSVSIRLGNISTQIQIVQF